MNPDAALTFLDFVKARHSAYEARQRGEAAPWSADPIVASRKFTNVFRVLDHGSQFVFRLAEDDPAPQDLLMRLFLYRHTGRVEVWEHLHDQLGSWPIIEDLEMVRAVWKQYRGEASRKIRKGVPGSKTPLDVPRVYHTLPVFTSAYLVFPQTAERGTDKLDSIVNLTQRMAATGVFRDFLSQHTQQGRFGALCSQKGVADFMSMQILTDWGYVTPGPVDLEDQFVVPGPGALKGAKAIASSWPALKVIEWGAKSLRADWDCPSIMVNDQGVGEYRLPSYMDVQNCLCEFSKYVRFAEKPQPTGTYTPAHPGPQPTPVLPEHW